MSHHDHLALCLALAARLHPDKFHLRKALKKMRKHFRAFPFSFELLERASDPHAVIWQALDTLDQTE